MSMALLSAAARGAPSGSVRAIPAWQEASVLAALDDPSPFVLNEAVRWLADKRSSNPALARAVAGSLASNYDTKEAAARFLGNVGPEAAAFAPRLVPLLGGSVPEDREAALDALVAMGPKAAAAVAPQLAALLKAPDAQVRACAAEALGRMGPAGAAFASQVAVVLDDREVEPATAAAQALSRMGPLGAAYAPRIAPLLSRAADPWLRSHAAEFLSHMGPAAVAVLPQIASGLKSPDLRVRAHTAASLGDMVDLGSPVTALAPQVAELLADSEREPRSAALYALGRMGPAGASYARQIAALLPEEGAAEALGRLGADAAVAVPQLLAALEDPNTAATLPSEAVAQALGKMGPAGAAALPALAALLNNKNLQLRSNAVMALGFMGRAAAPMAPRLVALLKEPEPSINKAARTALSQLAAAGVPVAAQVVPLLHDADSQVAANAQMALEKMRDGAAPVVPQLAAMLSAPGPSAFKALEILDGIGATAVPAAPQLVVALKWQRHDSYVSAQNVSALTKMGPAALAAVPQLAALLADSDPGLRTDAAEILGSIGPAAGVAPQLGERLKDPAPLVRQEAAESLGGMGAAALPFSPQIVRLLGGGDFTINQAAMHALDKLTRDAPLQDRIVVLYCLAASHASALDASRLLLRAYLYRRPDAQDLILIRLLGNRRTGDERAVLTGRGGLSSEAALAALQTLSDAWGPAQPLDAVREDMAEAIAVLAPIVAGQREHAPLLMSLEQRLKPQFPAQARAVQLALENRWYKAIYLSSWLLGAHIGVWTLLLLAYPHWYWVRSFFFWNTWRRRFCGCFYMGVLITGVPFLRRRMFRPFKESLLPRDLFELLNEGAYSAAGAVLMEKNRSHDGERLPLTEVLGKIRGRVVLQGGSGVGKTQLLLRLAQASREPVVFLTAADCSAGVIAAIQNKLPGELRDEHFLRTLILAGGLKVLIDGLNEAPADACSQVTQFVEDFKGDCMLATQLIGWQPPDNARVYVLQPLLPEQ